MYRAGGRKRQIASGTVQFEKKESVHKAIELYDGVEVDGLIMKVREDRVDDDLHESNLDATKASFSKMSVSRQTKQSSEPSGQNGRGRNIVARIEGKAVDDDSSVPQLNKVFVLGLVNSLTTSENLKEYFKSAGNVVSVSILPSKSKNAARNAIVEYDTNDCVNEAITKLHNSVFHGKKIGVREYFN